MCGYTFSICRCSYQQSSGVYIFKWYSYLKNCSYNVKNKPTESTDRMSFGSAKLFLHTLTSKRVNACD